MKNELKTLADAIRYFADEQVCIDTVAGMRWPNGPECPACLSPEPRQHWLKNQRRWQCRECGKQYSVKVNTIFEDSAIKLDKWLPPCGCFPTAKMAFPAMRLRGQLASLRSRHGSCYIAFVKR